MQDKNEIILVDENDNQIWTWEKLEVHEKWILHRAFSIFIFNSKNELLLQQRAKEKYHSWWLWTNTVCSHPKPWENLIDSAKKRITEEMGFSTDIKEVFSFVYKSEYENWLTEHEYDHVFIWYYDNSPNPNPSEVMDYKWIKIEDLKKDIEKNPDNYTSWLKIILKNKDFNEKINNNKWDLRKKIINIIWQIRIYSLIDIGLFSYAIWSSKFEFIWIVLLHLSFLFYLEYTHKHSYRLLIPRYIWIFLWILWILFYPSIVVIGYILSSMLYVRKNIKKLSPFSPIARGLQYYFLASWILWLLSPISFLSFLLLAIRNFAWDLRDVIKDKKEEMNTLPIFLWFKNSYKYIHIFTLFITSFFWIYISWLNLLWLLPIYLIQILTYNITTR